MMMIGMGIPIAHNRTERMIGLVLLPHRDNGRADYAFLPVASRYLSGRLLRRNS